MNILAQRQTLTWRFSLGSMLILVLGMSLLGAWVSRALEQGILHSTANANSLYIHALMEPLLPELARAPTISKDTVALLDRHFHTSALKQQVIDFRIWGPNGLILYDSRAPIAGHVFPVEQAQVDAWAGEDSANIKTFGADDPSGVTEVVDHVLENYSPIRDDSSGRIVAVTELYQSGDELQQSVTAAQVSSWFALAAIMVMIYLLLIGFVRRAGSTIAAQQSVLSTQVTRLQVLLAQNQELADRVRRSASRRSEITERYLRRISADLHDGPAQDISIALLCFDRSCATPDGADGGEVEPHIVAKNRKIVQEALQRGLAELRAISSGLGLPELEQLTPHATVTRVVAMHEQRTGTNVDLFVGDLPEHACLTTKLALYRVIQEALSNAYRYAGGRGQAVDLQAGPGALTLHVYDSGPGFDVRRPIDGTTHLGIAGMRERVQSMGGEFVLDSTPTRGTHIIAHLPLTAAEELGDG